MAASAIVGDHEIDRGHEEKEVGAAAAHFIEQPGFLIFAEEGQTGASGVLDVVHLAVGFAVDDEVVAIGDGKFAIGFAADGIGSAAIGVGGWGDAEAVRVNHFADAEDASIGIAGWFLVEPNVVLASGDFTPVDVQVSGLLEVDLGEVGGFIGEDVAALFEGGFTKVDALSGFEGIGPASVVFPGADADVAEHGAALAEADGATAADVVDQFVVVEGEDGGHVALPSGKVDATGEVGFVVFPEANDVRCEVDDSGGVIGAEASLHEPGLGWHGAMLLIDKVAVHDGKVGVAVQLTQHGGVSGQAGADAALGVLIGAGAELEAEVVEALGIVGGFAMRLGTGKSEEAATGAGWHLADVDLVMVFGVR